MDLKLLQRAQKVLTSGLSGHLFAFGSKFVTGIYWHVPDGQGNRRVLRNGSIFFVDIGEGVIGITADHVYKKYLEDLATAHDLECQVGELRYRPEVIGRSPKLDIATFRFSNEDLEVCKREAFKLSSRPEEILEPGRPAAVFGYPGQFRRPKEHTINWILLSAIGQSTYKGIEIPHDLIVTDPPDSPFPDVGGCSGGPIFSLPDNLDLEQGTLWGVVTDFSDDGVMMGSSLALLEPSGHIGG